ncbi:unnamed protein product [Clonostachys rhizophaga]|uniref:Xylanolytic transcriptional activator regulatory domain-containing protein n=1 Tax=Clonostachys rhizophaga TaxID=160324 RepID=A0A9N9YFC5_9HYPO|nr:unnamed protein product [Clonostachys rhizophaga]
MAPGPSLDDVDDVTLQDLATPLISSTSEHRPLLIPFNPKDIPCYVKPLPPNLGPVELAYLKERGGFSIPEDSFRDGLIQVYIEYVYPHLPCLDLNALVTGIDNTTGSISLIVLHAVMFAGLAFVGMCHISSAGFSTRKATQTRFFEKVRLLYEFDCEPDRVALVQALLLMTLHSHPLHEQKDMWYWTGRAISEAYSCGLHRAANPSDMTAQEAALRKKLWWCVFVRDRLVALGMRRGMQVTVAYDAPMLTRDDFDSFLLSLGLADGSFARDMEKQRRLSTIFIATAKLCIA